MKTLKASIAFVLAIAIVLPAVAFAQTDARFVGVVLDPSGAQVRRRRGVGDHRRSAQGLAMNMQYTLGKSYGTSGGANGANTAANNARTEEEFEYEDGYNNFDVRHTFNRA